MGCQLRLLLLEIRAPEQTGQGQTGTHGSVMKILGRLFKIEKGKKVVTVSQCFMEKSADM